MKDYLVHFLCIGMLILLIISLTFYWQNEMTKATYWMLAVILDALYLKDVTDSKE